MKLLGKSFYIFLIGLYAVFFSRLLDFETERRLRRGKPLTSPPLLYLSAKCFRIGRLFEAAERMFAEFERSA